MLFSAQVHYSVDRLPSRYDTVTALLVRLDDGSLIMAASSVPNDADSDVARQARRRTQDAHRSLTLVLSEQNVWPRSTPAAWFAPHLSRLPAAPAPARRRSLPQADRSRACRTRPGRSSIEHDDIADRTWPAGDHLPHHCRVGRASPPTKSARLALGTPSSSGSNSVRSTSPSAYTHTVEDVVVVSSSSPSPPWSTRP